MAVLEETLDIYWRCMVADMTNKWFLLLIPIVFVCLIFGQDVTKGRIRQGVIEKEYAPVNGSR